MTPPPASAPAPPPDAGKRRRRVRGIHVSLGTALLLVLTLAGSVAFLLSEAGLPFVVARVIEQSGGRLVVEGPSGSLARTMRFRALEWRGTDTTVAASNVVVEWSPLALFSNRLAIDGLGAARIDIALRPSTGGTTPPASLTLPLGVTIGEVAVTELTWQAGPRHGRITGLAFGYAGDEREHRIRGLRLASDIGAIAGDAKLDATAPFATSGDVALTGDGPLAGAKLDARLSGTLAALVLDARGTLSDVKLSARTTVTPFERGAFRQATASLSDVDLAAFVDTLPRTRLTLDLDVGPADEGVAGTFRAANGAAGPLDEKRIPLAAAEGRFAYGHETLALSEVVATVPGGGRVRGEGSIDLAVRNAPSRWRLTVANLDLARVSTALAATRLSGTLDADVDGGRQSFSGDLAQDAMSVSFAATYAERRVDVTRFRAEANGGVVSGTGRIALDAPRAFDVALDAQRFDPSRFGALPKGVLSGKAKATGVLVPEWRVEAAVDVAAGSQLSGVALGGTARGAVTRRTLANAAIDVSAGAARLHATGSAGAVGDALAFVVDVPRLAELVPLLPHPPAERIAGRVHASGTLRAEPGGIGGDVDLTADALAYGDVVSIAKLALNGAIAPGGAAIAGVPIDARSLRLSAAATRPRVRGVAAATASASVNGTLAHHAGSIALTGDGFDVATALDGGVTTASSVGAGMRWDGRVAAFANRGDVPFALEAPAALSVAAGHVRVGEAVIAIADGHARVGEFAFDDGRITTRGAFDGIPLASIARLAGQPLPLVSTLTMSGEWDVAATPRLNGTLSIRREAGDVYGVAAGGTASPDLALRVETLSLAGRLVDDTLDARLDYRSARVGRAQATLSLASVAGTSPGHIARTAPLAFSLDAELQSLAPLQPWLGTTAVVNGAFRIALTGRGTLAEPILAGTIAGDDLRIDAPPYGIALRDGRVRAHLADGGVNVDEISIAGGDGRFTASGTLVSRRGNPDAPRTRIAWNAKNFRATNRPDLRLVVDGEGTLAIVDKHLDLTGNVRIVDGRIEYERSPPGRLGPDVVVVGRPRRKERGDDIADLPLKLDVDVDLGSRLTFVGGGLETGLSGRVRVTTSPTDQLLGQGTIVATNGTYFAFGQKLTIDRGRVIFDGPLDNPSLDVVALRKNLAVEAGVELTGTARVPRVRITSNPAVPENEALAWLVTGEAPSSTRRGGDIAALSAASAALLSSGGKPLTTQIAQSIGLDDITVRGGGVGAAATASNTSGQIIVFGKRLTDRLSVGYEQGLTIATNALRIEYALSSTLTLRAEAGTVSGVGLVYRRAFD